MICNYNIKNHIYDKLDYLYTPIRILNSYEINRNYPFFKLNKGLNKEKEIKDNGDLYLNDN